MRDQQSRNWELKWQLLVADAWADPALKERLLQDTEAVLRERGMQPPAGVRIKVIEDTDTVQHLVLPTRPPEGELSEEDLQSVAGGDCGYGGCRGYRDAPT